MASLVNCHTELAAQALDYYVEPNYRTEYIESSNKAVQKNRLSIFQRACDGGFKTIPSRPPQI